MEPHNRRGFTGRLCSEEFLIDMNNEAWLAPPMPEFDTQISTYRQSLLELEQKMQSSYDKAVMTLSGGALGVSMSFLKDVVGTQNVQGGKFLLAAWICWGLSVTGTLASFYTSSCALRKAVQQTDDKTIYLELCGGRFNLLTKILNFGAGLLFLAGVASIVVFVAHNLP
jgi:hypothetical protein